MPFDGFSKDTVRFLSALSRNNTKAWFEAHRDDYVAGYLEPAKAFVSALAPRLKKLDASVQAVPELNGSIMRIHRDVRFSKDKAPYKDHLDLFFWSGLEKSWENPGFYFRLTPTRLLLGAGSYHFGPPQLARYRQAVLDAKKGAALAKLATKLRVAGYEVGGATYKKVPPGQSEDHPRAALLKHGGLYGAWEGKHPKELGSEKVLGWVVDHFKAVSPMIGWLNGM